MATILVQLVVAASLLAGSRIVLRLQSLKKCALVRMAAGRARREAACCCRCRCCWGARGEACVGGDGGRVERAAAAASGVVVAP